ncbi:hypothetical protein FRB91_003613 [Serendipita sp. 411]|nr:hypothetical protein FRB91_003613 [Serendipita sp. 411]
MATLLPPPKRRKLYHGVPEPEPKPETPVPNIVVQFINDEDGKDLAPAVTLPADLSREQLETLLNKLSGSDDPVPFSFHVSVPGASEGEDVTATAPPTRIVIANSLNQDVLLNTKYKMTTEDVFVVHCSPQAVFKVRPATRCSSTLTGHSSAILCASFSPTGQMLATGSGDTNVRLWDLDTETPSHVLSGHRGWVLCVEWEARERKLASGGHDGQVRIWDPKNGKVIGDAMKGHTKWITSLAWEPIHINAANPRVASSSKDGTIRVWSMTNRRTEYTLGGHTASVNLVRWGGAIPSGVLYTASSDRTVRIWEAAKGRFPMGHWPQVLHGIAAYAYGMVEQESEFIATMRGHVGAVYRLTWSADSRMLVSASKDSTVKIWDLKTYKLKMDLPGHTDEVYCVDFVADKIVSGGRDKTLKIWKN